MEVMQPETRLIYCPHPVVAQQGRRIVRADFLPGESSAEYLERHGLTFTGLPVDLRLEGAHVPRAMWARVRPKNGQTITVDGLFATNEGSRVFALQRLKPAGGQWVSAERFLADWAKANKVSPDGDKAADIVANAPATEENFFLVPKVVE